MKQVRSFLGLAGYYREMIPHYADKAQPLVEITRKRENNCVSWTAEQEAAFEAIKRALAFKPIVKAPDLDKLFLDRSNASHKGIGAVFMHDGAVHPICYVSRQLVARETRYSAIERERLALVRAVEKFHIILYGTLFIIQTDHQALMYLSHANTKIVESWGAMQDAPSFCSPEFYPSLLDGRQ